MVHPSTVPFMGPMLYKVVAKAGAAKARHSRVNTANCTSGYGSETQ